MNILILPLEIQSKILLHLPLNECIINSRVCKNWCVVFNSKEFWKDKGKQLRIKIKNNDFIETKPLYTPLIKKLSRYGVTYGSDKYKSISLCIKRLMNLGSKGEYFTETACYRKEVLSLIKYFLNKVDKPVVNNIIQHVLVITNNNDITHKFIHMLYQGGYFTLYKFNRLDLYCIKIRFRLGCYENECENFISTVTSYNDLIKLANESIIGDNIKLTKILTEKIAHYRGTPQFIFTSLYCLAIKYRRNDIASYIEGLGVIIYGRALENAISIGDRDYINYLLPKIPRGYSYDKCLIHSINKNIPDLITLFSNMKISYWYNILSVSILNNNHDMIELCLTKNISSWNKPLMSSIKTKNSDLIKICIDKGANEWTTALIYSIENNDRHNIDIFINKIPIIWSRVLNSAILKNNFEIVEYCINKDDNIINDGMEFAIITGNHKMVKYFFRRGINITDSMIKKAKITGHKDISEYLNIIISK